MYFETAELKALHEWKVTGQINRPRYDSFLAFPRRRKRNSLKTLLSQADRFTDFHKTANAYAEAYTLTYFLNARHPAEYVAYFKLLAKKPPLIWDEPATRLSGFKSAFGEKLPTLDAEFVRSMKSQAKR